MNKNEALEVMGKRIDEAINISKNISNFKEGWQKLKEIQNELKEFQANKDIKDQLWTPLNQAFDRIKKREKDYFKELKLKQEENYKLLKPLVEEASKMSKTGSNLKDVWSELVLIQKKFKGLSLSKEKHQSLWNTLQESFELVKKREDDLFELQKDSWEENYSKLLIKVEEIKTIIEESTSFREIWEKVREVKEYFSIVKTDRERQDALLDNLQKHISKLKKIQNERKEEIEKIKEAGFDKLNKLCNRALNEANTNKDLKEVFNRLKIWQKDVFFASKFLDSQEEKDELKSKIDEAFSIYKKRQEEYFNSKKDEWLSKQKDFLEKMIDKKESLLNNTIPKIKNSIENSKEYLRKIKNELEELENIEENNRKVDFLTNKIGKVESEIIEKENSIIDINKKIDEISQTISDINKKINK